MIAHVAGLPLEELVPSLGGGAAGLALARGWLMFHLRRRSRGELRGPLRSE